MYQVFRLRVEGSKWVIRKEGECSSLAKAKQYVIAKSKIHTDLASVLQLPCLRDQQLKQDKVVQDFCFNNPQYLVHRRFFINHVPIQEIEEDLRVLGINVVIESLPQDK